MTQISEETKKFAREYFENHREEFIQDLAFRIENGIEKGEAQIANGEYMTLEESKRKLETMFAPKS